MAVALQVLVAHSIHHTIVRESGGIHLFMVQSTFKSQMDFSRAQKYLLSTQQIFWPKKGSLQGATGKVQLFHDIWGRFWR